MSLGIGASLNACAPLTHVYLADLWCQDRGIQGEDRDLVIKGSMFPDVFQVATVSKHDTHGPGSYESIAEVEDLFQRGQRLHHYVDARRKEILEKSGIVSLIDSLGVERPSKLLQMMEDQVVFERLVQPRYAMIFDKVSRAELETGIEGESVVLWNQHLQNYLSLSPLDFLKQRVAQGEGFWGTSVQGLQNWLRCIPEVIQTPEFQAHVTLLLSEFGEDFGQRESE